jgi:hypothetical protein
MVNTSDFVLWRSQPKPFLILLLFTGLQNEQNGYIQCAVVVVVVVAAAAVVVVVVVVVTLVIVVVMHYNGFMNTF